MAVNDLITLRKGTASEWASANPTLALGEPGYDSTNRIVKIGDGITAWSGLSNHNHTSSNITDFNSSVSGLLPVKSIVAGSNITISSSSGTYTINSTASGGGGSSSTSVLEYGNVSNFPASGVGSTIYISTDNGRIYRWAGSVYQELGPVNTGAYASLNGIVTIPSTGDQYWDLVTLLLRCDGLNNGTKFVDSSSLSKTLTRVGSAVTSTVQYHAGISSLYFNGTDAVVEVGSAFDSTISGFGTADFTIELWFRTSDTSTRVSVISSYDAGASPATGLVLQINGLVGGSGSINVGYGDNSVVSTSGNVWTANTWNHVAVVRSGSAWTVFVNGVSRGTATNSTSINAGAKMSIGALKAGSYIQLFSGYLDDIRITNGIARYSSTFIPSTDSYPVGTYIAPKTSSVVFS
jgi:hypothetical protein